MARPRKEIDREEVQKLAAINCTVDEIADFFNVSKRTIQRRFGTILKKGRSQGKISLKRLMYTKAKEGNVTMMIWLSKQMLGYADKVDQTVEAENTTHVTYDTQFAGTEEKNTEALQTTPGPAPMPSIN